MGINLIQDGYFQGCSQMEGLKRLPLPKICHALPKGDPKIYESGDTPPEVC